MGDAGLQHEFAPAGLTLPRASARSIRTDSFATQASHESLQATGSERATSVVSTQSAWVPAVRAEPESKEDWRKAHHRLGLNLDNVAENVQKARNAGVEPARNTWLKKLAGAAVAGLFTIGVVAAGLLTGGAGFAVAASLSGVMLVKMSADAVCAKALLNDARKNAAGDGLVQTRLPMGADSIGNLIHWLTPRSMSPEARMKLAGASSFVLNLGIGVAATALAGTAMAVPAAIAIGVAHTGLFVWSVATHGLKSPELKDTDGVMINHYIEVRERTDALWMEVQDSELPEGERGALLSRLKTQQEAVLGVMDTAVDRIAEQVEAATVLHGKAVQGVRGEVGRNVAHNLVSELGYEAVVQPLLGAGKLLLTGAEALRARGERHDRLEDLKSFHAVANDVQAELDRLRGGPAVSVLEVESPPVGSVPRTDNPSEDELISDARMQSNLRNI